MQPKWLNDGEPDENGDYIAVIENNAGARISTFKGKSYKEVADKLLESQTNANREISRLRRPDRATAPASFTPRDTSVAPADRMRLTNQINDPDTVVEAVTEIVTAASGGVNPRAVTQNLANMTNAQQEEYFRVEAEAFLAATPDYYPVQQNQQKLWSVLMQNKWDITRNNLGLVFQTLWDQGEMIPWPSEPTDGPPSNAAAEPNGRMEPNPPTPTNGNSRPRSVSTGLRSRDASASAPPPPTPKKLTRAELDAMPRAEYEARLRDPNFRRQVDAL